MHKLSAYRQFFSSPSSLGGSSPRPPPPPDAPSIIAEMTGGAVHLRCSFAVVAAGSGSSLGHVVAWSRLSGPEGRREELKRETTVQTSALIELDGFNLRLGDKVGRWSVGTGVTDHLAPSQSQTRPLNSQSNLSTLKSGLSTFPSSCWSCFQLDLNVRANKPVKF